MTTERNLTLQFFRETQLWFKSFSHSSTGPLGPSLKTGGRPHGFSGDPRTKSPVNLTRKPPFRIAEITHHSILSPKASALKLDSTAYLPLTGRLSTLFTEHESFSLLVSLREAFPDNPVHKLPNELDLLALRWDAEFEGDNLAASAIYDRARAVFLKVT